MFKSKKLLNFLLIAVSGAALLGSNPAVAAITLNNNSDIPVGFSVALELCANFLNIEPGKSQTYVPDAACSHNNIFQIFAMNINTEGTYCTEYSNFGGQIWLNPANNYTAVVHGTNGNYGCYITPQPPQITTVPKAKP